MQITDEHIDDYLRGLDIELLPHQKEIFKKMASGNVPRIVIPPKLERSQVLGLIRIYEVLEEIALLEEVLED